MYFGLAVALATWYNMLLKQIKNSKTESDYIAFSFLLEYWWGYFVD